MFPSPCRTSSHNQNVQVQIVHYCSLLKVHYSKGELSKEDVERLFALSCAGPKKSGPIRSYKKKSGPPSKRRRQWCPVEGCNFLGAFLPQHLTQVHNMDNKGTSDPLSVFCRLQCLIRVFESCYNDMSTLCPKNKHCFPSMSFFYLQRSEIQEHTQNGNKIPGQ